MPPEPPKGSRYRVSDRAVLSGIIFVLKMGIPWVCRLRRWVVTMLVWLARYGRLTVLYERRADFHEALLHLGCSLVCLNYRS